MRRSLAEGNHFVATLEGTRLVLRVRSQPRLGTEEGGVDALRIDAVLRAEQRPGRQLLFDVSGAPSVFGQVTESAITNVCARCTQYRMRLAVLVRANDALQRLQYARVLAASAASCARIFEDEGAATAFLDAAED